MPTSSGLNTETIGRFKSASTESVGRDSRGSREDLDLEGRDEVKEVKDCLGRIDVDGAGADSSSETIIPLRGAITQQ